MTGDKSDLKEWGGRLQKEGMVAVSVNYRFNRDFLGDEASFPGPVQDIKCAVQWLRHNASEYGVDPDRIYILGGSAGGHLATMVGVTGDAAALASVCAQGEGESSAVAGVVSFFSVYDWHSRARQRGGSLANNEAKYVGDDCHATAGPCTAASPLSALDPDDPPMLILHSTDDPTIGVDQSRELAQYAEDLDHDTTYVELNDKGHGWMNDFNDPDIGTVRDEVIAWLRVVGP